MLHIASILFFGLILAGTLASIVALVRGNATIILAALRREMPAVRVQPIPTGVRITQDRYAARLRSAAPRMPVRRAA